MITKADLERAYSLGRRYEMARQQHAFRRRIRIHEEFKKLLKTAD